MRHEYEVTRQRFLEQMQHISESADSEISKKEKTGKLHFFAVEYEHPPHQNFFGQHCTTTTFQSNTFEVWMEVAYSTEGSVHFLHSPRRIIVLKQLIEAGNIRRYLARLE